ncbi:MAG: CRISPR-associated endonuclease Cas2 [Campylobacter sp.]|nr:CRISPR-associated endonuclease Cas2 [Campylobacter sp.]
MRVIVMFDIPTKTKKERKSASKFRNSLIKRGFFMMQYSVYMRICKGCSSANASVDKLVDIAPPRGNIRALIITEKQFDNIKLILGDCSYQEKVSKPKQLTLF